MLPPSWWNRDLPFQQEAYVLTCRPAISRAQAYLYFVQSLRSFDDLKRRYDGKRDELMRHRTNLMVCVH
jgi:hypothetical protein